jgi:hypothetical protein
LGGEGRNASAKSLEDLFKEKGVIAEEAYKDGSKNNRNEIRQR